MKITALFLVALAFCSSLWAEDAYCRGVNMAGPEFGPLPGKNFKEYTFNNEASFKYFAQKGLDVFRVPIRWERLQPAPGGAFDKTYLDALKQNVAWAKKYDARILIDVHNYCRYGLELNGERKGVLIDVPDGPRSVTTADYCDLWKKLSTEFKDESGVYGYGLMNEPNNLGKSDWKATSNAAIKAIRENNDNKIILVAGDHWSGAEAWERANGPESWVKDPADNFIYEAHCYFDSDGSGTYKKTYVEELGKNPDLAHLGRKRLKVFVDWCQKNKVRGFLGEFGVPREDPRWCDEVLEDFMKCLDEAKFGGTYWAAGTYWGEYMMTVQPKDNYTTDRPQLAVLLRHLSPSKAPKDTVKP